MRKDLAKHLPTGDYCEIRVQRNKSFGATLLNGDMISNSQAERAGMSARVYKDGCWGMSCSPGIEDADFAPVVKKAKDNAAFFASKAKDKKPVLPSSPAVSDRDFSAGARADSQTEIISFIKEIDNYILKNCPKLKSRTVGARTLDMEKSLAVSDGALSYSLTPRANLAITMTAEDKDGLPVEIYEPFGGLGNFSANFKSPGKLFPALDELYEHIIKKTEAVYPEAGTAECILSPDLAGILSHEAVGHTTEADMVITGSVAGEMLGKICASPLITMIDFAHTALGIATPVPVEIDDEGVKATDALLIDKGILTGYMHNKESALHFGMRPTGNARAFGFCDEPLIRMRNTAILPGASKLANMLSSIDDGYYLLKSSNGQADATGEFMFGIVCGYEIKKGKIARAIKDTTISGKAFDMLKTVSMVSDDMVWSNSGMCGKKQSIPVGMGGPALKCKIYIGGK